MDMQCVALQLLKEYEARGIRPVVLDYELEGGSLLEETPMAYAPIQLTFIVETLAMPIEVYVLTPYQEFTLNYVDVEFAVFGLGPRCRSDSAGQNCYLRNDYIEEPFGRRSWISMGTPLSRNMPKHRKLRIKE
jgi:hypothetical protein